MKPNDQNGLLPAGERPLRILIIAGSNRRQFNCPGVDSKSRALMLRMSKMLPQEWEIDFEDIGNVYGRARIQSCNACVSTAMALCVWPCNCYEKGNSAEPDLMWDLDLYARLDLADAWAIIGPTNWYGPTSTLKLFFDRLVCMNGGNPDESLIDHKNPEMAMALEKTAQWKALSVNHLEGRTAAFFTYTDDGGVEMDAQGRPKILEHKEWFNPAMEPFEQPRDAYRPLVWQCRYGGIEVPDALWTASKAGVGKHYSENQAEDMARDGSLLPEFDDWCHRFAGHVGEKGAVKPARWRAYGYKKPGHRIADIKLKWRELQISAGTAPVGSAPAEQHALGLNEDATFSPKKGEGEKLRGK